MKLSNEKLQELYSRYDCEYILVSGSSVVPYISEPNDVDIFVVLKENDFKDYPFITKEDNLSIKFIKNTRTNPIIDYQDRFRYCYPEETVRDVINILDDKNKYLNIVKADIDSYIKEHNFYNLKNWYHVYITKCILENNSYELTEEQINNVDIIRKKREGYKTIIDTLISNNK